MTKEKQEVIDQVICQALVEFQSKRAANRPTDPDRELVAGDTIQISAGEATVEQRHVDAVALFLANHWTADATNVSFRVQPPTNDASK